MKNNIYIAITLIFFSIQFVSAQDISLTNANLTAPGNGEQFGKACFTLIAEEGVSVTSIPAVIEVSMSYIQFDETAITGFNSDKFQWSTDVFAGNVLRGVLVGDIADIDNGGGGAQICIPVIKTDQTEYNDPRNGYQVNIVPGSLDQGGNSGADNTARFGFSNTSNSSMIAEKDEDDVLVKWTHNSYDDVAAYDVKRSYDGKKFEVIATLYASNMNHDKFEYFDIDIALAEQQTVVYSVEKIYKNGTRTNAGMETINYEMLSDAIQVFPNPTSEFINISNNKGGTYSVNVFDSNGKSKAMGMTFDNSKIIEIRDWSPGIYFLEFQNVENGQRTTKRVMVVE